MLAEIGVRKFLKGVHLTYIRNSKELRSEPVSFPFEERIKGSTLRKSYLWIVAVLLNIR